MGFNLHKKVLYDVLTRKHFAAGLENLRTLERKLVSVQSRFAVPFVYRGEGYFKTIEPRQNPMEIEELYKAVCELRPSRVLEVGTARGGTLYLWTQAAANDAVLVSVDLPEGDFGGAYPVQKVPFYQSFARPGQTMHLLRKDSHDPRTVQEVRTLFAAHPVDFAFIDGDHTYDGVKADFLNYGPLVRPGGIIAFHDILPRPDMPTIQVDRFWREIRGRYETVDLIGAAGTGRQIGIGLLRVGKERIQG